MKRILKVVFIVMAFIATTAAVYAITDKFLVKVQTSNIHKKDIFNFEFAADLNSMEVGVSNLSIFEHFCHPIFDHRSIKKAAEASSWAGMRKMV